MANDPPALDADRIERAARCLSPRERELLVLSRPEHLGLEAAAKRLGFSSAEAESLLADVLCKLDRALRRQQRPRWRFW